MSRLTNHLTALELELLTAIDHCEFGDNILDPVWTWAVSDSVAMPKKSISGVVASLSKKGWVEVSSDDCGDATESVLAMTLAGFEVYARKVGRANISKWLDESDLAKYDTDKKVREQMGVDAEPDQFAKEVAAVEAAATTEKVIAEKVDAAVEAKVAGLWKMTKQQMLDELGLKAGADTPMIKDLRAQLKAARAELAKKPAAKVAKKAAKKPAAKKAGSVVYASGKQPTRCIETGVVYDDAFKAAEAIGKSRNSVKFAIHRGGKTGGLTFEYVSAGVQKAAVKKAAKKAA